MCGEIGGDEEERTAEYIAEQRLEAGASPTSPASRRRPARRWATPARSSPARQGTAAAKAEALEAKGVRVGRNPTEVAEIAVEILGARV